MVSLCSDIVQLSVLRCGDEYLVYWCDFFWDFVLLYLVVLVFQGVSLVDVIGDVVVQCLMEFYWCLVVCLSVVVGYDCQWVLLFGGDIDVQV